MNVIELDHIPESDVPLWCLQYADWLSDRGVPDAGWRALGMLAKYPSMPVLGSGVTALKWWFWPDKLRSPRMQHCTLPARWFHASGSYATADKSRSSAMEAAADAFLTLDECTQIEIFDAQSSKACQG